MKKIIGISCCIVIAVITNGQDFSANKMIDMLSLPVPKLESQLAKKKFHFLGNERSGDTIASLFRHYPAGSSKKNKKENTCRKFLRTVLNATSTLTYQTTAPAEFNDMIKALKKKGFYCDYEKDSTISPGSYMYQCADISADASIKLAADTTWYSITFHKKIVPGNGGLHFAEDLLQFTSHEYLVYYFGVKNVIKDIYYFGEHDIVNCSVLLINSRLQVIFIWKDELNRRGIGNLFIGGQHKLKSQEQKDTLIAENNWLLKSGIHAGMSLFDLRILNENNIVFCAGDAPNPGLVLTESTGKVDFKNKQVILACANCMDEKFATTKLMNADEAMKDGRILYILTIVLYPEENKIFD